MTKIAGKNILITGAASGIGKIMSRIVLEKNAAKLIIWDINPENIKKTMAELSAYSSSIFSYLVDVSDSAMVQQFAEKVKSEVGNIDILINNAGVVVGKPFHEHSHKDIDLTMQINTSALMHIALCFINQMIENKSGHIVNIASAAGMVANPRMSVYCASKWAVIGWSESVRLEMESNKTGVNITTVTPYYINTGMFEGVKSLIPILNAEKSAKKIISAIERNRLILRMPFIVYLLPFSKGILPLRWFDWIVGKLLGIYHTMDKFTGR